MYLLRLLQELELLLLCMGLQLMLSPLQQLLQWQVEVGFFSFQSP
jgi:hypothetical protein